MAPLRLYYLDTSALVKRYIAEPGSRWVQDLYLQPDNLVITSLLTLAEAAAAFGRKWRLGDIDRVTYQQILDRLRSEFYRSHVVLTVDEAMVDLAVALTGQHPLRGYDALHLAAAMSMVRQMPMSYLVPVTFVSADQTLLAAAAAEGLAVEDPMAHP